MEGCRQAMAKLPPYLGRATARVGIWLQKAWQLLWQRVTWEGIKRLASTLFGASLSRWYLLSMVGGFIIFVITFILGIVRAGSVYNFTYWLTVAAVIVGAVASFLLFLEHYDLEQQNFSSYLSSISWVLLIICKVFVQDTSLFACPVSAVRHLSGIIIVCSLLLHLPSAFWARVPYAKWSQLQFSDWIKGAVVLFTYASWVLDTNLCPGWTFSASCQPVLLTAVILTFLSMYALQSCWQEDSYQTDAEPVAITATEPVPFLRGYLRCGTIAVTNALCCSFWIWAATMQLSQGISLQLFLCTAAVLTYIYTSLAVWWRDYPHRPWEINWRNPSCVGGEVLAHLRHRKTHIANREVYEFATALLWVDSVYLLVVLVLSNGTLGFSCPWKNYSAACISANILSVFAMTASQILAMHPNLLGVGGKWGVPEKLDPVRQLWTRLVVLVSIVQIFGWIIVTSLTRKVGCGMPFWNQFSVGCAANLLFFVAFPLVLLEGICMIFIYNRLYARRSWRKLG